MWTNIYVIFEQINVTWKNIFTKKCNCFKSRLLYAAHSFINVFPNYCLAANL